MRSGTMERVAGSTRIMRAKVTAFREDGTVEVRVHGKPARTLLCDVLATAQAGGCGFERGDEVLVALEEERAANGCILGRVGPYREPDTGHVNRGHGDALTIVCGEASITLSKTGKVLIRGLDIVNRATRCVRIRGGSIKLN